ncbi:MAG: hypothetical protein EXQ58_02055 [Acidobacteria bacterium]|nr:hypothetical protein [Acidobacteriota bacterium]
MIEDTLAKIEARLGKAGVLAKEQRTELLGLLSTLKTEIGELSKTHPEQAQSITAFTEVSTHEDTRRERDPRLLLTLPGGTIGFSTGFRDLAPQAGGDCQCNQLDAIQQQSMTTGTADWRGQRRNWIAAVP